MYKTLLSVVLALSITACATNNNVTDVTHDPYTAALADITTTEIGLHHGLREVNPLGVSGSLVFKGLYLFEIRPGLSSDKLAQSDRLASSIWYGAAVNNLVTVWFPVTGLGLFVGGLVGYTIYQH